MSYLIKTLAIALLASTTSAAALRPANQIALAATRAQAALITSAPNLSAAAAAGNSGCPGQVVTDDLSMPEPYCCVGGVYAVAPFALTSWFYNHTGVAIPSVVYTPTTCVEPVPMTAVPTAAA